MVLLSASICTKTGKVVVGRQFMEMSRSRVEGLLAAFPKLINEDEQHTFVETENVRYVYQPMDNLYMVLITTKNSNILEDLETLRLFAKVIPEYCREMTEMEVQDCAFELIFAFDEIVALGYRESVNLAQIRQFTEMDSHDENIFRMQEQIKEAEQKEIMKRRAKEIGLQKKLAERGIGSQFGGGGGMGGGMHAGAGGGDYGRGPSSSSGGGGSDYMVSNRPAASTSVSKPKKKAGGMKLGKKGKKEEDFEAKLAAEGVSVGSFDSGAGADTGASALTQRRTTQETPDIHKEAVHIKVEEKITLEANRDGGLESMEVKGIIFAAVSDPQYCRVRIQTAQSGRQGVNFQCHPNVDKKKFNSDGSIVLKNNKPYPDGGSEVGVVKWRFTSQDEDAIPLTINCWPDVKSNGSAEINVDYELVEEDLKLENVIITIPVPGSPAVNTVDGEYSYDRRDGVLEWKIPVIDSENKEGSLEFNIGSGCGAVDEFFPVSLYFTSTSSYAGISIESVEQSDEGESVPFSTELSLAVDAYEYV